MKNYSFLMIGYDKPELIQELQNIIPHEEIYDEEGYGLENNSHVTLAACLDKDLDVEEIKKELEPLTEYPIILTNISKFDGENYDVLKCDVGSYNLIKTNRKILGKFPSHSEHKDFHPHMTIAYLKKGMADKYLKDILIPLIILKPRCFMWKSYDNEGNDLRLSWI